MDKLVNGHQFHFILLLNVQFIWMLTPVILYFEPELASFKIPTTQVLRTVLFIIIYDQLLSQLSCQHTFLVPNKQKPSEKIIYSTKRWN